MVFGYISFLSIGQLIHSSLFFIIIIINKFLFLIIHESINLFNKTLKLSCYFIIQFI